MIPIASKTKMKTKGGNIKPLSFFHFFFFLIVCFSLPAKIFFMKNLTQTQVKKYDNTKEQQLNIYISIIKWFNKEQKNKG